MLRQKQRAMRTIRSGQWQLCHRRQTSENAWPCVLPLTQFHKMPGKRQVRETAIAALPLYRAQDGWLSRIKTASFCSVAGAAFLYGANAAVDCPVGRKPLFAAHPCSLNYGHALNCTATPRKPTHFPAGWSHLTLLLLRRRHGHVLARRARHPAQLAGQR
jgi:hypothetical protein